MTVKNWETSAKDGIRLHGKTWLTDHEPTKIICFVHGHGEHIGRYDELANAFVEQNMACYAIDMRGHGKSDGKRGHIPSYEMIFSDIEELVKRARVEFLEIPIVLYGHSLGGNYAANYILHNKTNEIQSLVLSSPWFRLAFEPPENKVKLARIMRKIWPSYTDNSRLDAYGLSHDEQVVFDYQNDPLVHDKITVSLFTRAIQYGEYAIAHAAGITIPVLLMHGDEDPITSIEGSKAFAEYLQEHDQPITFKRWEGMKHETHHEIGKAKVEEFVTDWILKN